MVKLTKELILELDTFSNPNTKIARLLKENKLFKIKQGFYETNKDVNPFYLTNIIYGPSYISFQTALAYYGLIPERVYAITSATFGKHKIKEYKNIFGTYLYMDIPKTAYPFGIEKIEENGYCYFIATKEKAICDMLYEYQPVYSVKDIKKLLFEDLRIDEDIFLNLNMDLLKELSSLYKTTNHKILIKYLERIKNEK